jgi:hypothetical protein
MKTREEVEQLKADWLYDPCYDLETVEGFEDYKEELLAFSKEKQAHWSEQVEKKRWRSHLHNPTFSSPRVLHSDGSIESSGEEGLSRLEFFTAMAMQGLIASGCKYNTNNIGHLSVTCAESTLKALYEMES